MTGSTAIQVNQLLGRLVYFHVLFIEPRLSPAPARQTETCCLHRRSLPPSARTINLAETEWAVLPAVAAGLGSRPCPGHGECCPSCAIRMSARAIAEAWLHTEQTAYGYPDPIPRAEYPAWPETVADRIATTFRRLSDSGCGANDSAVHGSAVDSVRRYPLVEELVALWTDTPGRTPVVSWLNHCDNLDDIARHLKRGTTP